MTYAYPPPPPRSKGRPRRRRLIAAATAALLTLTGLTVTPAFGAESASAPPLMFDFGTANSPVADGYTRVAHTTLYSAGSGFGLDRQIASRDRGAPDALQRDFVVGTSTFSADIADGTYWVRVVSGDQSAANYTTLAIEGVAPGLLSRTAGSFATWSGAVEVADGRLDVSVGRDGRLNVLTVSASFPPTSLAGTAVEVVPSARVALTWEPTAEATGYEIWRAGAGEPALAGSSTTTSFTDTDAELELGAEYTYTVRATLADGTTTEFSEPTAVRIALDRPAPATPEALRLDTTPTSTTSMLRWDAVEGALAYDVERTDYLGRPWTRVERVTATEHAVDLGPASDGHFRWYYRVSAVGPGGVSAPADHVDLTKMIEPHVVSEIDTSIAGGGARPLVGDITGDGRLDIVMMQPHHINAGALRDGPVVASLTAFEATGELLWQVGEVDPLGRNNSQDIPAQIHDLDGDGRNEVIAVMYPDDDETREGRLYVFDGETGEEKWSFDLPDPMARDAIIFVDASGQGFAGEILLKDRYTKAWMVTAEGELLWTHEGNTGQYPWPYDFDGDGREEIMLGYDMVSPDGELLWRVDLPDHADTIWIADIDSDGVADVLLGGASTSAHRWDTGEVIWLNDDTVESQNIIVGKFRDDIPGLQVFGLDRIDRTTNGLDGLFMIDAQGNTVWQEERATRGCYGSIPEIIHNWAGDGRDQIMIWNRGCGEPAGIHSGDGDFMTELSDVRMHHADICGDDREEVIEYLQGQWLRIVSSSAECDMDAKVTGEPRAQSKREYNYTRYTAGETAIEPLRPDVRITSGGGTVSASAAITVTGQATPGRTGWKENRPVVYAELQNAAGKKVLGRSVPVGGSSFTAIFDAADVPPGRYTIKVSASSVSQGNHSDTASLLIDGTAPAVTVKTGPGDTVGADGTYSVVSFKLYDAGKIDRLTLNGVEKDLVDDVWSDLNRVRPGAFGGKVGENTLVVSDVAGNTTTVVFTLTGP
ncbi:MAG: PQQ-binding-like beta-propeller repeat protein [Aeromicrobium sp.]